MIITPKRCASGSKGTVPNTIPGTVPKLKGTPTKLLLRLSLSSPGSQANIEMLRA